MLFANSHTLISRDDIGKISYPFTKTYDYVGDYIDEAHVKLSEAELDGVKIKYHDIFGWLRKADALKLYEMAYFSPGDILEFGTNQGLSSTIMAQAVKNSPHPNRTVLTVDIAKRCTDAAIENHRRMGVDTVTDVHTQPAEQLIAELKADKRTFGFIFVDHDHSYEATVSVISVIKELEYLLQPEQCVLFHDFNDRRNLDPENKDYGVVDAITDHLSADFQPFGTFGSVALYRFNRSHTT